METKSMKTTNRILTICTNGSPSLKSFNKQEENAFISFCEREIRDFYLQKNKDSSSNTSQKPP